MTTTPLPPTGHAYSEAHGQMSHRLLEQARQELAAGDRIQASEKAWGAAAHILKALTPTSDSANATRTRMPKPTR